MAGGAEVVDKLTAVKDKLISQMHDRQLSRIGDAHFAMADFHGADSDQVCELAYLYSKAVDSAKHDGMATLRPELEPKKLPDWFAAKKRQPTDSDKVYKSQKPLGHLHRMAKEMQVR